MGYKEEIQHGDLAARLNAIGQSHVFRFWAELTPDQQQEFARQLESLDWNLIKRLDETVVKHPHKFELKGEVEPAPYYENQPQDPAMKKKLQEGMTRGEQLLRE